MLIFNLCRVEPPKLRQLASLVAKMHLRTHTPSCCDSTYSAYRIGVTELIFLFLCVVLGMKPRVLHIRSKYPAIQMYHQPDDKM